jgi:hypothetical protein
MIKRILQKLFRRQFIQNLNKGCAGNCEKRALIYYKTDPLVFKFLTRDYTHTNYWEIVEMVKIFNKLGYSVDVIDRTVNIPSLNLQDKYDIFLGIGAGDSGQFYSDIAFMVPRAVKILYAMGPEPVLSNELIKKRYDYFSKRHPGLNLEMRRVITKVDIDKAIKYTDAIFINGNNFTRNSYEKFGKDIYRVFSSSRPDLMMLPDEPAKRNQNKFLYFGGNGNIVKGLDLVIEIFSGLPNLELYIGAPDYEEEFNKVYLPILKKSKNIHHLGFVKVGSALFNNITSECGYVILPSCSEGCATSVTTCMRRGLIPIVTYEDGLDVGTFGHLIKNVEIDSLRKQIVEISQEPKDQFVRRGLETYIESEKYTQENFSKTFEESIISVLHNFKR